MATQIKEKERDLLELKKEVIGEISSFKRTPHD